MLVTRDAELAQRAQVMRLHGMSRDAFDRFTADGAELVLRDRGAGLQVQPDRHRRGDRPAPAARRRARSSSGAQRSPRGTTPRFAGLPLIAPPHAAGGRAARLAPVRAAPGRRRARSRATRFIERLFAARHRLQRALHPAAPAALLARPLRPRRRRMFPHSQRAYERMLSLPIYTRMTDADVAARDRRGARAALSVLER